MSGVKREPWMSGEDKTVAAFALVALILVTLIVIAWRSEDAEIRRIAPHEDRCILSNGRVVHLNVGSACMVSGVVTDRW